MAHPVGRLDRLPTWGMSDKALLRCEIWRRGWTIHFSPARVLATKVLGGTGSKLMGGISEKGSNGNAVTAGFDKADIVPPCLEPRRDCCPDLQEQDA